MAEMEETLLTIGIELTRECNLRCIYCYADAGDSSPNELTTDEVKCIIDQAVNLGARSVRLLGGEPLLVPGIFDLIEYTQQKGAMPILLTNGSLITGEIAERLAKTNTEVNAKLNTFQTKLQEFLNGGIKGSYQNMRDGLENLMKAGLADAGKLALSSVITKHNYEDMVELWRFVRTHNITPYFELLKVKGREKGQNAITNQQAKELFYRCLKIDEKEFKCNRWSPHPSFIGRTCNKTYASCYVTSTGYVQPCSGLDFTLGNIREAQNNF